MPAVGETIGSLEKSFGDKFQQLRSDCVSNGFRIVPYDGARSPWQQARYWRQSRSSHQITTQIAKLREDGAPFIATILEDVGPQNGNHVTDALPGQSFHQFRRAIDSYVVSPETGRALWREKARDASEYQRAIELYAQYGSFAKKLGMIWGGDWSFGDFGHVQGQKKSSPLKEFGSWPALDAALRKVWPHP